MPYKWAHTPVTTALSRSCKMTPTVIRVCVSKLHAIYFRGAAAKLKARMAVS